MAAFVTPIILDNQEEHPGVWALSLLPVYMGQARMGSQAHWLSDVLAGAAVGVAAGVMASRREHPLLLELTERWRLRRHQAAFLGQCGEPRPTGRRVDER